ncbi:MAG: hypothetical protein WAV45_16310 [Propionibacteriaceae bacterium]|nr:hypothetical protein [Propionibacteriaceae bacterium]
MTWVTYWLTCAVEIPISLLLLRRLGWLPRAGWGKALFVTWAVNLTQPVLSALHLHDWPSLLSAELIVALSEGLVLWWALRPRVPEAKASDALACAVIANTTSFLAGAAVLSFLR